MARQYKRNTNGQFAAKGGATKSRKRSRAKTAARVAGAILVVGAAAGGAAGGIKVHQINARYERRITR